MSELWSGGIALAGLVTLAIGAALIALASELGRFVFQTSGRYQALVTPDGPPLGAPLPSFVGRDPLTGQHVTAEQLVGRRMVLLFVSPECGPCGEALEAVRARQRGWEDAVLFVIIVRGASTQIGGYLRALPEVVVLEDTEGEIFRAFEVEMTPQGLLVDPSGRVRMKGIVNTRDQLAGLMAGRGGPTVLFPVSANGAADGGFVGDET